MPTLESRVPTDRASRYLIQFCRHARAMGGTDTVHRRHIPRDLRVSAEWSDTDGHVAFDPWGSCTLTADDAALTIRVTADTDEHCAAIRDIVAADLARFSRRNPLRIHWTTTRRGPLLLGAAAATMIALHVGLGGAALASGCAAAVALIVTAKLALVVAGRFGLRHHRRARLPSEG